MMGIENSDLLVPGQGIVRVTELVIVSLITQFGVDVTKKILSHFLPDYSQSHIEELDKTVVKILDPGAAELEKVIEECAKEMKI
jgi:hypothetical protein